MRNILFKLLKPLNPIELYKNKLYEGNSWIRLKILFLDISSSAFIFRFFNLLKSLVVDLLNIIYFPVAIILYLFNYRILHLNTWQIGAFVQQLDTLVKENKIRKKKYKLLLFCPKAICVNNFFSNLYADHIKIKKKLIYYFFFYPLIHSRLLSINFFHCETIVKNSKYNYIHNQYFRIFNNYNLQLRKIPNEDAYLHDIKKKFNVESLKNVICLQQRDQAFYKSKPTRDSNILEFKETIELLLDKNYTVIRFVSKQSIKLKINNNKYFEILSETEIEKVTQYLLCKYSFLVICYQGGVCDYGLLSKSRYFLVNAIPININNLIKKNDLIIFKKFVYKKNNKIISFKDIFKKNLHLYPTGKDDINFIENSSNEIKLSLIEILENSETLKNKSVYDSIPEEVSFKISDCPISNSFINLNSKMF